MFCKKCGAEVTEDQAFCSKCGTSLKDEEVVEINTEGIAKRKISRAIILSIVTLGIYAIYWFICLTNEINKASGRTNDTKGGIAFLLSLVTFGIYEYFWAYKLGEKRDIIAKENAQSKMIYLVLALCGFSIIAQAFAQDALNKAIDNQ